MIISREYRRPAILLGNGLNNFSKFIGSWVDILLELSGGSITKAILNQKDITYPEFFDALCFRNKKATEEYRSLKGDICQMISKWRATNNHRKFIQVIKKKNIPILTTNYDASLLDDEIMDFHKKNGCSYINSFPLPLKNKDSSFTDYYPWYSYYTNHSINDIKREFAIWHIHGFQCYPRSIAIGAIDYANNIHRLKKYLPVTNNAQKPRWIAENSWVDIFFNCDLIIMGLSLESQETSLRWLLMEREKHFRRNEMKRRKTLFVIDNQHDSFGEGKKYLFDSLSINSMRVENSSAIYSDIVFE